MKQAGWRLIVKKAFDRGVGAIGLVVAAPIMAATAATIAISMGRPVLFTQLRPGLHGKPFRIFKFRTMREAFEEGRPLPDAARLTRVGKFLRATSVDELPQLFNVVRGELSLVGPRPLLMEYLPRYNAEQARRHDVLPGITGWAQIHGRNALTWEEKFRLDVWYVDHWSPRLDATILLKTVGSVFRREGIANPAHATMYAFMGETNGVPNTASTDANGS